MDNVMTVRDLLQVLDKLPINMDTPIITKVPHPDDDGRLIVTKLVRVFRQVPHAGPVLVLEFEGG